MAMRVKFLPQSMDKLRLRYGLAVDHVHSTRSILADPDSAPSGDPTHIFDTLDGFRIAVSRESDDRGRVVVHVSASLDDICPLIDEVTEGRLGPAEFLVRSEEHFRAISRDRRPMRLVCFSAGKGVPHWAIDEWKKGGPR